MSWVYDHTSHVNSSILFCEIKLSETVAIEDTDRLALPASLMEILSPHGTDMSSRSSGERGSNERATSAAELRLLEELCKMM